MKHFFPFVALVLFQVGAVAQFEYRSNWNHLPTTFKPYVIKLTTPSGMNILRDAPADHSHHHALMFAMKVDNVNFWEEYNPKDFGRQETFSIKETETVQDTAGHREKKIESTLTWSNGVGQPLLQEKRTISACRIGDATVLDWASVFTLPPDKEKAVLGGNNYHGLGMRFLESMDKDGRFFNSEKVVIESGQALTPCRWMAYTAKAEGKPVTVAIVDTKENPRPMLAFTMGGDGKGFAYLSATTNLFREPITLTPEKPITFRYKVALWDGEVSPETIEKTYAEAFAGE